MKMRFIAHYSSSKHNLYTVETVGGRRLLIECGCTPKQLQNKLDYKLDNIVGCLTSHEHNDHSQSAEWLLKNGIDCYMSRGTMQALDLIHRRIYILENSHAIDIRGFFVFPFDVNHDACEPLGFIIKTPDQEYLFFVTDTSHIRQRFRLAFNIIAICCNYDKTILQSKVDAGKINETFATRLLTSHMEKDVAKDYIRRFCNLSKCREIHLLHMSGNNIEKQKIRDEFEKEFFISTYIAGEKKALRKS